MMHSTDHMHQMPKRASKQTQRRFAPFSPALAAPLHAPYQRCPAWLQTPPWPRSRETWAAAALRQPPARQPSTAPAPPQRPCKLGLLPPAAPEAARHRMSQPPALRSRKPAPPTRRRWWHASSAGLGSEEPGRGSLQRAGLQEGWAEVRTACRGRWADAGSLEATER